MKADLGVVKDTWVSIHPGLYRYNTPIQIEELFRQAEHKIQRGLNTKEFYILLSQLNIRLKCSHSFVSPYNQKKAIRQSLYSSTVLPVLFKVIDKRFVITHNLSGAKGINAGDEIISIQNVEVKRIIDSLLTVSKSDGRNGLSKQLDNISLQPGSANPKKYALFDIYFPLFFSKEQHIDSFEVTTRSGSRVRTYKMAGLSKEARSQAFEKNYGVQPIEEKTWFTREVDEATVLFKVGDFAVYNWKFDFRKYLDSIFAGFRKKQYRQLILDIRQNEGGSDDARDEVLSYLIRKPTGPVHEVRRLYRFLSIPDSLLPYLSTWDENFKKAKDSSAYLPDSNGFYYKRNGVIEKVILEPKPNHFTGDLYLLSDVTNSSTTFILADFFKRNKLGAIVGETTGGTEQGINGGEIVFFYLPHSGIEMDVPLIYQASPIPRPDKGIEPDYFVPTRKVDIGRGTDRQLDFIMRKLLR